jgi:hypothetical protein
MKHTLGKLLRGERQDFIRNFPKNSIGAEIGVFKGDYSRYIMKYIDPIELHLIDLWTHLGEYYPDWGAYTNFGQLTTREARDTTLLNVSPYNYRDAVKLHEGNDLEILQGFPDHYFDWVYLDSSHTYEDTKSELALLQHKVKPGGLIAGDDWHEDPGHIHHGVKLAVEEFCRQTRWAIWKRDRWGQWCLKRA